MLRLALISLLSLVLSCHVTSAQDLTGKIEGMAYLSPTGLFRVTIPVLPELGGEISDTPNVVTFQDDFNIHVTIAAFEQDATQRWELSTRGAKDYLVYFFSNFILADFRQNFPGTRIESAKFMPGALDGALLAYMLVPGGTMFADRAMHFGDQLPTAKRGNFLFVRNGHVFVVSTELAEKVIEGKSFRKTTEEEDDILRLRLLDIVGKMTFTKPADPAPASK